MDSSDENKTSTNFSDGVMAKWLYLFLFVGLFFVDIWLLFYGQETKKSNTWIYILGLFVYPILALISVTELVKDPRLTGIPKSIAKGIWSIFIFPLILVGVGIAGWLLFSIFGWLATIPAWAVVIIVLLLVKK